MPELTIDSISSRRSFISIFLASAISSNESFLSILVIMKTLLTDLFTTLLTTRSNGLSISFSATYLEIRSMKSFPNFFALPSPTPWQFLSSSRVIGYCIDISSNEGSLKITNGGRFNLFDIEERRSLSIESKAASPPPPPALPPGVITSSLSSESRNSLSSVSIIEVGASRNFIPFSVHESKPYLSISLSIK
ncbi:hypothetical protein SDC9_187150 [bioreactor metagenome]|uniref:Uncharacterized protein n=1 Tax=bioreactor metagenome TaxID=1076179 RepID=A0A645HMF2_9ZZZZ